MYGFQRYKYKINSYFNIIISLLKDIKYRFEENNKLQVNYFELILIKL